MTEQEFSRQIEAIAKKKVITKKKTIMQKTKGQKPGKSQQMKTRNRIVAGKLNWKSPVRKKTQEKQTQAK